MIASRLSMGHARALLALEQDEDIIEASVEIIRKKLSVRETENLIKKIKNMFAVKAPKSVVEKPVDPNQVALENALEQQLGTRVKLVARGKRGLTLACPSKKANSICLVDLLDI